MHTITARSVARWLSVRGPTRKTEPERLSEERTEGYHDAFPDDRPNREWRLHPTKGWRNNRVVT